jgi:hypothetical protein
LRSRTLEIGKQLADAAAEHSPIAATAITISLDSTFIHSRDDGERHLEVRVGNVETVDGGRQVFDAVARADTDLIALLQRKLDTVGRTDITEVTAFTDGCPGLRAVLANGGVMKPPVLDWFNIAMRDRPEGGGEQERNRYSGTGYGIVAAAWGREKPRSSDNLFTPRFWTVSNCFTLERPRLRRRDGLAPLAGRCQRELV